MEILYVSLFVCVNFKIVHCTGWSKIYWMMLLLFLDIATGDCPPIPWILPFLWLLKFSSTLRLPTGDGVFFFLSKIFTIIDLRNFAPKKRFLETLS